MSVLVSCLLESKHSRGNEKVHPYWRTARRCECLFEISPNEVNQVLGNFLRWNFLWVHHVQTDAFAAALKELMALDEEPTVAIMCSEAVPWRCHRSLIGEALLVHEHTVDDIVVTTGGKSHSKPHTLTTFARVQGTRLWYPEQPTLPLSSPKVPQLRFCVEVSDPRDGQS